MDFLTVRLAGLQCRGSPGRRVMQPSLRHTARNRWAVCFSATAPRVEARLCRLSGPAELIACGDRTGRNAHAMQSAPGMGVQRSVLSELGSRRFPSHARGTRDGEHGECEPTGARLAKLQARGSPRAALTDPVRNVTSRIGVPR